ncbi:acetyltransferase [Flavobacterium lindanitolerans]|jgi:sugar O-acyltransferase (sialic acid O-acetyltransferase NeuD family)|uniref:acetyltransferase n=1 Tax=Flavobacterium lindanitolerans TaxID=428988 RepID=UPI0023F3E298|nr:acetyltransferase [Flavobacterium lindanitolerans]
MGNKVLLYGASGHCKVIIDSVHLMGDTVEAILDDTPQRASIFDIPVIQAKKYSIAKEDLLAISIGNNRVRKIISEKINAKYYTIIHPKAIISKHASIGEGTVVMAGAIINPDAVIGRHSIVNTGAVIDHDCHIGDYAHISPNASLAGDVIVGEGTQVGIGASVIQGIRIGKWAIIGAGAVIVKDVEDYAVVVGNPGKVIKYTEK